MVSVHAKYRRNERKIKMENLKRAKQELLLVNYKNMIGYLMCDYIQNNGSDVLYNIVINDEIVSDDKEKITITISSRKDSHIFEKVAIVLNKDEANVFIDLIRKDFFDNHFIKFASYNPKTKVQTINNTIFSLQIKIPTEEKLIKAINYNDEINSSSARYNEPELLTSLREEDNLSKIKKEALFTSYKSLISYLMIDYHQRNLNGVLYDIYVKSQDTLEGKRNVLIAIEEKSNKYFRENKQIFYIPTMLTYKEACLLVTEIRNDFTEDHFINYSSYNPESKIQTLNNSIFSLHMNVISNKEEKEIEVFNDTINSSLTRYERKSKILSRGI